MSEENSQIQKVEPEGSKALVHQAELRYVGLVKSPIVLALTGIRAICVEECLLSVFAILLHALCIGYGGYIFYTTDNPTAFFWLGGMGSLIVMLLYPSLYQMFILPPKRQNSLISVRSVLLWMVYLTSFYGLVGGLYQAHIVTHGWSVESKWSHADLYWPLDAWWSNCCVTITAWCFALRLVAYCESCPDDRNRRSASFLGSGKTAITLIALASNAVLVYVLVKLTLVNALDYITCVLFFLAANGVCGFWLVNAYTRKVPQNIDTGFELR